jgi:hypothetical protein
MEHNIEVLAAMPTAPGLAVAAVDGEGIPL